MRTRIVDFENYLIEEEKSSATIEKYLRDVNAFSSCLYGRELCKGEVIAYKKSIAEAYAPASVNSMLVSVNAFLKFIGRADCCVRLLKIQRQIFANERKELTAAEYESIDELNYLATLLSDMSQSDLEKFEAVIDAGEYAGSVKDLINLTQNLDCFEFYSGVHSEEDLGRMFILDFEAVSVPEHLIDYIDYEAYGRDVRINDGGHFAPGGYVANNHSRFIEIYTGRDDIPEEHRVFSMPRLSIREQMAAYKDVIDRSALEGDRHKPKPGREER